MIQVGDARRLALEILRRIDEEGAYTNLILKTALGNSNLCQRDRAFCTHLVYGTTRMKRACDHLVDRFLHDEVESSVRRVLRLGAYQLHWGGVPPHAAVSATVAVAPRRARGLCNAVLRQVAREPVEWPSAAVELSYPDWIVRRLVTDLGEAQALTALSVMNEAAPAVSRSDGYYQDRASQLVAGLVVEGLEEGGRIFDLCAAPGGKATAFAAAGSWVVAADRNPKRLGLVRENAEWLQSDLNLVLADARFPPFVEGCADRVLVDAPCSGLGVLRRRADARWRVSPEEVVRLADLQVRLLEAAVPLVRPGGYLIYSVCTLTAAETIEVDERFREAIDVEVVQPGPPWRSFGRGGLLLPQDLNSEGMAVFRYRVR